MNDYYKWDERFYYDDPFDFGYDRDLFLNISKIVHDQLIPKSRATLYNILTGRVRVNLDTFVISQGQTIRELLQTNPMIFNHGSVSPIRTDISWLANLPANLYRVHNKPTKEAERISIF